MSTDITHAKIPLCKDCAFFVPSPTPLHHPHQCRHPEAYLNRRMLAVTGELRVDAYCDLERGPLGGCLIQGKWFIPKEQKIAPQQPKGVKLGLFTLIAPEPTPPKQPSLLSRLCAVFMKRLP